MPRKQFLPYVLLAAAAILLYGRSVGFDFVWDDEYFVVRNPAIRSWNCVPSYFTDGKVYAGGIWAPMYRPLRNVSYLLDYSVGGLKPSVFHAHNVALHAANCCLVYWVLLQTMTLGRWWRKRNTSGAAPPAESNSQDLSDDTAFRTMSVACILGALWWTAHPVHTESVAWVKSRDELLFALFYLGALGLFLRRMIRASSREDNDEETPSGGRWLTWETPVIVALFACAMLTKEMAASLPLVLLLLHAFFGKRGGLRGTLLLVAMLGIVLAGYVVARGAVLGEMRQKDWLAGSFGNEMLTMSTVALRYVRLALVPNDLIADYQSYPVSTSLLEPRVLVALGAIVVLAVAVLALWKRLPEAAFGCLFFAVALLPVSNLVSTMQFLAERFLYLPLVGVALALSSLCLAFATRVREKVATGAMMEQEGQARLRMGSVIAGLLITVLAFGTCVRLPVWRNEASLATRTFLDAPPSGRILLNYAKVLAGEGRYSEALPVLRKIVSGDPRFKDASPVLVQQGLAVALLATGSLEEGGIHAREAVRLKGDNPDALATLALYYGLKGDHRNALKYYEMALATNPGNGQLRQNRDLALRKVREETTGTVAASEP